MADEYLVLTASVDLKAELSITVPIKPDATLQEIRDGAKRRVTEWIEQAFHAKTQRDTSVTTSFHVQDIKNIGVRKRTPGDQS